MYQSSSKINIQFVKQILLFILLWALAFATAFAQNKQDNDAGISQLVLPANTFSVGEQDIAISIQNFGSSLLESATINWSINGELQTPYTFVGPLNSGSFGDVLIGFYDFVEAGDYTIKVWTSQPNQTIDSYPDNDAVNIELFVRDQNTSSKL